MHCTPLSPVIWLVWLCLCMVWSRTGFAMPPELTEKVLAFYYLWYGSPATDGQYQHWDHEVLPHWDAKQRDQFPFGGRFEPPKNVHSPFYPAKGPYSSSDPATIKAHIHEMLDANITGMVVSWWGPEWRQESHDTQGVSTDQVLPHVVAQVEQQQHLRIAFHLEPYQGRSFATMRADLQHLMAKYSKSDALMRVGGKPVYFVYDSYHIPAAEWATLLMPDGNETVRGTELDGVFIGLMLDLQDGKSIVNGGFDGVYTYFASDAVSYASKTENWARLAKWGDEHNKLFVASIGPGYDDSRIRPWNAGATRSREDGARYKRCWEHAQSSGAHAVSITSFNEWGEGTQIEAVQPWVDADTGKAYQDYGAGGPTLYMDITREQAVKFIKSKSTANGALKSQDESDSEL